MTELPEITDAVLDQWAESAAVDEAAERSWSVHPLAVLAVVGEVKRLRADLAAAELMVRRLAEQAVSDEARIAAVEAAAGEVHGHGADDERAEVERLRGIISRIAALAASPTPTGPEPAKRPCCARPGWCACDPLTPGDEHCRWFAATPEPTKETP